MNEGRISSRSRSELSTNNKESDEGDLGVGSKIKVVKNIFNTDCNIHQIDNKGISQQLINSFNNYGHTDKDK